MNKIDLNYSRGYDLADAQTSKTLTEIEIGAVVAFFELYNIATENILKSIGVLLDKNKTINQLSKSITSYILRQGDIKIVKAYSKYARDYFSKAWENGQEYKVKQKPKSVIPKTSINFFDEVNGFDLGNTFRGKEASFNEAVKDALKNGRSKDVLNQLETNIRDIFKNEFDRDKMEWILRDHVTRSRNFSRIKRMESIGITEIEIVAIMDKRTSKFCKELNGRRFSIKQVSSFIDRFTSKPIDDDFWNEFKSPSTATVQSFSDKKTSDVVDLLPVKAPPFHPRCRTISVSSSTTKFVNQSGSNFNGKFVSNDKISRQDKQLKGKWQNLTAQERLSKLSSYRNARWDKDNLIAHDKKDKYHDFGKKRLDEVSYDILKNKQFDNVFTYVKDTRDKVAFYSNEYNALVLVDMEKFEISTTHKFYGKDDYNNAKKRYVEFEKGK